MRYTYKDHKEFCFSIIGMKCTYCNSPENLEVDHIDPSTKLYNTAKIWSKKYRPLLLEELKKCQPLCKECHKIKSNKERSLNKKGTFKHGTFYSWMKAHCTCTICIETKRAWYEKRNSKRRKNTRKLPYGRKAEHGDILSYTRGCRCIACKKEHSNQVAFYRAKRKIKQAGVAQSV